MTTPRWPVVIFDLDGTLVDASRGLLGTFRSVLNDEFDVDRSVDDLRPLIGPPFQVMLRNHFDFDEEMVASFLETFRARYFGGAMYDCDLFPGVSELLVRLEATSTRVAIATSKEETAAGKIVRHVGLPCEVVAGSTLDNTRLVKADVLREALRLLDHDGPAVMIGDHAADVIGAHEVGIDAIGVTWGFGSPEEIAEAAPLAVVHDIEQLTTLLYDAAATGVGSSSV